MTLATGLDDPTVVAGADAAQALGTDPERGLSAAEVTDRRARFGFNRLDPAASEYRRGGSSWPSSPIPLVYLLIGGGRRLAGGLVARGRERTSRSRPS